LKYKVVWLPEAREALRRIHTRREAFQKGSGRRAVSRIREHTRKLEFLPEAGLPRLRETVVPPFRVLYRVLDDRVEVITIFHGALDLNLDD
jgi:plasmid stabilization system protein ParE